MQSQVIVNTLTICFNIFSCSHVAEGSSHSKERLRDSSNTHGASPEGTEQPAKPTPSTDHLLTQSTFRESQPAFFMSETDETRFTPDKYEFSDKIGTSAWRTSVKDSTSRHSSSAASNRKDDRHESSNRISSKSEIIRYESPLPRDRIGTPQDNEESNSGGSTHRYKTMQNSEEQRIKKSTGKTSTALKIMKSICCTAMTTETESVHRLSSFVFDHGIARTEHSQEHLSEQKYCDEGDGNPYHRRQSIFEQDEVPSSSSAPSTPRGWNSTQSLDEGNGSSTREGKRPPSREADHQYRSATPDSSEAPSSPRSTLRVNDSLKPKFGCACIGKLNTRKSEFKKELVSGYATDESSNFSRCAADESSSLSNKLEAAMLREGITCSIHDTFSEKSLDEQTYLKTETKEEIVSISERHHSSAHRKAGDQREESLSLLSVARGRVEEVTSPEDPSAHWKGHAGAGQIFSRLRDKELETEISRFVNAPRAYKSGWRENSNCEMCKTTHKSDIDPSRTMINCSLGNFEHNLLFKCDQCQNNLLLADQMEDDKIEAIALGINHDYRNINLTSFCCKTDSVLNQIHQQSKKAPSRSDWAGSDDMTTIVNKLKKKQKFYIVEYEIGNLQSKTLPKGGDFYLKWKLKGGNFRLLQRELRQKLGDESVRLLAVHKLKRLED